MNFTEYQKAASRTAKDVPIEDAFGTGLVFSVIGLVGEAGELANLIKKIVFHGHDYDREAIKIELGDCLWYLTDLASRNGLTLEEIADANIDKLLVRYPNGFSKADSRNRKE